MIYNYNFHLEGPISGFSSNYMSRLTIDYSETEGDNETREREERKMDEKLSNATKI